VDGCDPDDAATAERWGGAPPPVVRLAQDAPLPASDLIVLGTPETLNAIAKLADLTESPVSRVPFVDEQGFAVESRAGEGGKLLVIAGKTPRGAYNGAVLMETGSVQRQEYRSIKNCFIHSLLHLICFFSPGDFFKFRKCRQIPEL
jgi:hypothetical protein